jgi:hypothetical protein
VDWKSVLGLLQDTGFDGAFCIEFPVRLNKAPFGMCVADLCERFTRDLTDTSHGSEGQPKAAGPAEPLAQGDAELVTVYQTNNLWEAGQVRMWFEDEGIPCAIVDGNMPVLYPLGVASGVKVQVLRENLQAALRVLREHGEA